MSIICGTDFSHNAQKASEVAAALAARMGWPLALVHVIEEFSVEALLDTAREQRSDSLRRRLQTEARTLAARYDVKVEPVALTGVAYEALAELAKERRAPFLIVASLSAPERPWAVGSIAERVAQCSSVPVLVIRDAARLLAWLNGERALSVLVGVDGGAASRAALDFAASLRGFGPVDLLLTQIAWPMGEYSRYGVAPPVPVEGLRPELEALLVRDLTAWAGEIAGAGAFRVSVRPGLGRVDAHLDGAAREADADLIVVGAHQRSGAARLWQASVSRGVLHGSATNVASVPRSSEAISAEPVPEFRRVLAATDLSEASERAVATAYGVVQPGGVVYLTYVRTPLSQLDASSARARLMELVPPKAQQRGARTEFEVVEDDVASLGICRTATR
ncbi:MAG TPA: universal stress protein, partial [Polyangiaceae bacterium]|nr:universal stress protein [Polyangiaceae bacterium]